jgi:putative ABC transport system permease protein
MNWIAWKMLTGDRTKYLGIVFGVAFGSLLIAHQTSIFVSLMKRTGSQILDITEPDIWVMDKELQSVDEVRTLPETDVYRVRGVPGVEWAVRLFKGQVTARTPGGIYRQCILMGLDDATLIGAPRTMLLGTLADLRRPDALIVDAAGYSYLFPGEPLELGKTIEINDHRGVIVGVCETSPPFITFPIVFARYSTATLVAPKERNTLGFVLTKAVPGQSIPELCRRIEATTELKAMSQLEFVWLTVGYYIKTTGIPVNFGITVMLGFVVGTAIAGQTFYLFTIENLKQFGNLKAMGLSNGRIVGMILFQGAIVGVIGFGIGMGLSAAFFEGTKDIVHLKGFAMPWQVMAMTAVTVIIIVGLASLLSIRKVLVLEPAVVFK